MAAYVLHSHYAIDFSLYVFLLLPILSIKIIESTVTLRSRLVIASIQFDDFKDYLVLFHFHLYADSLLYHPCSHRPSFVIFGLPVWRLDASSYMVSRMPYIIKSNLLREFPHPSPEAYHPSIGHFPTRPRFSINF